MSRLSALAVEVGRLALVFRRGQSQRRTAELVAQLEDRLGEDLPASYQQRADLYPHKQISTDATGMFSRVRIQMWKDWRTI